MTHADIIARLTAATGPDREILDRLDRNGDCWLWTGKLDARGRGRVWRNGKIMLHHRAIWEIVIGPIPKGALLCHHCDNPQCANPSHLYVGDSKTNVDDMMRRRRHWTQVDPERARQVAAKTGRMNDWTAGSANPKAKLSALQVKDIRESADTSMALAARYGVDRSTIRRIRRGTLWSSI